MNRLPATVPAFFWHFLKPSFLPYMSLFLIAGYWAAYSSIGPYTLKVIIDAVEEGSGNPSLLPQALLLPSLTYIAFYILWEGSYRLWDYIFLRTIPKIQKKITEEMFDYLQHHSHAYFQEQLAGGLTNRIYDMSWGFSELSQIITNQLFTQVLAIVIAIFTMYTVHQWFALILLGWAAIFLLFTVFLSKKAQQRSRQLAQTRSTLIGRLIDSISNIFNIRMFSRHRFEKKYMATFTEKLLQDEQSLQRYMLWIKFLQGVSVAALIAAILVLLIFARKQQLITVGDFALILGVSKAVVDAVKDLASEFVNLFEEIGACQQALAIIVPPHQVLDAVNAQPIVIKEGKIEFKDVTFNYERNNNIFANKSIQIAPGEKVGLVGFSGSGKTTFANLILRYFDIASGEILIDSQNIALVTQESLREQITMIPQDITLFHRTIMENIRYARPTATDEEVIQSAKQAHCHEFIIKMPDGYHTEVGERGMKLSGGQRQRIAIARALLKSRPILILDEATASLDLVTEQQIQDALAPLMHRRTCIVIAHRLSTLIHMDRILVFDGGQIVEEGSHEALIKLNGHYTKLWMMQAHGLLPEQKE